MTAPDRYAAAALIEQVAIGDEGVQAERTRMLLLDDPPTGQAREIALAAVLAAAERLAEIGEAVRLLGLEP